MLGGAVFVPLLVIAILRFRSVAVAFAVSAGFSIGAMLGFFFSVALASWLVPRLLNEEWYGVPMFLIATAGSIGGAAFTLWLLRRLSSGRGWERR